MILAGKNLTKKYANKIAVDGVSIELEEGHIYALLGQNGCGKSTLMKMAAGLVKPDKGEITLMGNKIGPGTNSDVAYMPTEAYFYEYMKVADVGKYYSDFFRDFNGNRFRELLIKMDISMKDEVRNMSSGQVGKLKLAATMARDAKLYLLDEPLNGIDLLSRELIIITILEVSMEDNTIVISSHLVDELEKIVDHVIFMDKGSIRLVQDAEELRETYRKSIADVYGEILK